MFLKYKEFILDIKTNRKIIFFSTIPNLKTVKRMTVESDISQFGGVPLQGEKGSRGTYLLSRSIRAQGNLHHNANSILLEENKTRSIHIMLLIHL